MRKIGKLLGTPFLWSYKFIGSIFRGISNFCKWVWDPEAFSHTFWHVLGALLPFLVILLFSLFAPNGNLNEFLKGGDFCLFGAAILTPGAYSLSTYYKKSQLRKRKTSNWPKVISSISVIVICALSLCFSWIHIHSIYPQVLIYEQLIVTVSTGALICSVFIFYYAKFLEEAIQKLDYAALSNKSYDDFERQYNR